MDDEPVLTNGFANLYESRMKRGLANYDERQLVQQEAFSLWYGIVTQYSTQNMTVATDKLSAIFGVAAELQRRTKFTYLHGL